MVEIVFIVVSTLQPASFDSNSKPDRATVTEGGIRWYQSCLFCVTELMCCNFVLISFLNKVSFPVTFFQREKPQIC